MNLFGTYRGKREVQLLLLLIPVVAVKMTIQKMIWVLQGTMMHVMRLVVWRVDMLKELMPPRKMLAITMINMIHNNKGIKEMVIVIMDFIKRSTIEFITRSIILVMRLGVEGKGK